MNIKSNLARATAQVVCKREERLSSLAIAKQNIIFKSLITKGSKTKFGKEHEFEGIKNHSDFCNKVPIRDYEGLKGYFDHVREGYPDILWPGKPKYLAKTSGTTSGAKYIPITRSSISNHINSARNALFSYVYHRPKTKIFDGKMLFLSGSPVLEMVNGIPTGRLSGIVNHEIPSWFSKAKLPGNELNSLQPWDLKVEKIIADLWKRDLRVVSGIPPWIQMFFEKIIDFSGKNSVCDVFPNLELYIHGGVNYEPYSNKINQLAGKELSLLETYPASEGFLAYQDNPDVDAMRLVSQSGIFYEFVPLSDIHQPNPIRLLLQDVQVGVDYAIVLSSNAGLWAYLLGDVIRFISLNPWRIKVTGRVSQYISAFGEHVIAAEVENSISHVIQEFKLTINEFTVAPQVAPPEQGSPYHEWFIEFDVIPSNLHEIETALNFEMSRQNAYYSDLINNKILSPLKIKCIQKGGFKKYMMSIQQYGEQFKVKRLSNNRNIAEALKELNVVI
ncbi:MAG: GH3 auxin-responsive promoter family protein [Saprospiraceae bacterium]|nr:GH3 auxin-responsive promoter family protein [Saprospiraceae bacterium]